MPPTLAYFGRVIIPGLILLVHIIKINYSRLFVKLDTEIEVIIFLFSFYIYN